MLPGIDVSKWQGQIDWTKAAVGRAFSFVRRSDGLYLDPLYESNAEGAKAAGLLVGPYHFFRAGVDPLKQADTLASAFEAGDISPVLDVETLNAQASQALFDALHVTVTEVYGKAGRYPILYTSPGFWDSLPESELDGVFDLWVADWTIAGAPKLPRGWTEWRFWQRTNRLQVPGIHGYDDGDVWNGTLQDLRVYAATGSMPAVPAPPSTEPAPPDVPSCEGSWRLLTPAEDTEPVQARATELLDYWRTNGGIVGSIGRWGSTCDEVTGSLLIRYSYEDHPPDKNNEKPHTGVTAYACTKWTPSA
jgi:GH25 family lysozyme M1 (1,4-beta-N-acetylmuramidase)